jgi:DNA replication protein DnaC
VELHSDNAADNRAAEKIGELLTSYVADFDEHYENGTGLLLFGPPGTGKTGLVCAVLTAIDEKYRRAFYTLEQLHRASLRKFELHDAWKRIGDGDAYAEWKTISETLLALRNEIEVLVIDDVGKEHAGNTGFAQADFEFTLRYRFDQALPTIMTSNIHPNDWSGHYHSSMSSFLHDACAYVVEVPTSDLRQ